MNNKWCVSHGETFEAYRDVIGEEKERSSVCSMRGCIYETKVQTYISSASVIIGVRWPRNWFCQNKKLISLSSRRDGIQSSSIIMQVPLVI